jgi:hypothetical protein
MKSVMLLASLSVILILVVNEYNSGDSSILTLLFHMSCHLDTVDPF